MKTTRYAVLAVLVAGVLASCEFSGSVYVEPNYDELTNAEQWTGDTLVGANPASEVRLDAGESIRYKVVLPSSSLEAVYYELDQPLDLTVYDRFNAAIASSRSSDFFRSGTLALSTLANGELAPADVAAQFSCRGSCVIERRSGSPRYVRIHNPSEFAVTTNFYAILRDFEDTNEGSAPEVLAFGTTEGALETIGDVDFYSVTQDGFVELVFGTLASGLVSSGWVVRDSFASESSAAVGCLIADLAERKSDCGSLGSPRSQDRVAQVPIGDRLDSGKCRRDPLRALRFHH